MTKKYPQMKPLVRQMWQGKLINRLRQGEEFLQTSAYGIPDQERKLIMDGDEAIAQLKKLVGTCGNEKDVVALNVAIDAINEVWN